MAHHEPSAAQWGLKGGIKMAFEISFKLSFTITPIVIGSIVTMIHVLHMLLPS